MNGPLKVLIVDNDDSFHQKTRALLESTEGITVVGEARDGREAIALVRETCPDVILLDIDTPHASNLETVVQIREQFPHIKIIVLHGDGQEQLALDALRKGALGHLVKEKAQPAEIVRAIRTVGRGEAIISPSTAGRILDEVIQEQQHKVVKERKIFEWRLKR